MKTKSNSTSEIASPETRAFPRRGETFLSRKTRCIANSYDALHQGLAAARTESRESAKAWVKRMTAISL